MNYIAITIKDIHAILSAAIVFIAFLRIAQGREKSFERIAWWITATALLIFAIIVSSAFFNWVVVWTTIANK